MPTFANLKSLLEAEEQRLYAVVARKGEFRTPVAEPSKDRVAGHMVVAEHAAHQSALLRVDQASGALGRAGRSLKAFKRLPLWTRLRRRSEAKALEEGVRERAAALRCAEEDVTATKQAYVARLENLLQGAGVSDLHADHARRCAEARAAEARRIEKFDAVLAAEPVLRRLSILLANLRGRTWLSDADALHPQTLIGLDKLRSLAAATNDDTFRAEVARWPIRRLPDDAALSGFRGRATAVVDRWRSAGLGLFQASPDREPLVAANVAVLRGELGGTVTSGGADPHAEYLARLTRPAEEDPALGFLLHWAALAAEADNIESRPAHRPEEKDSELLTQALGQQLRSLGRELFIDLGYGPEAACWVGTFDVDKYVVEPEVGADIGIVLDHRAEDGTRTVRAALLQAKRQGRGLASVHTPAKTKGGSVTRSRNDQLRALLSIPDLGYYLFHNEDPETGLPVTVVAAKAIWRRLSRAAQTVSPDELDPGHCRVRVVDDATDFPTFMGFVLPQCGVSYASSADAVMALGAPRRVGGAEHAERLARSLVICRIGVPGLERRERELLEGLGYRQSALDREREEHERQAALAAAHARSRGWSR